MQRTLNRRISFAITLNHFMKIHLLISLQYYSAETYISILGVVSKTLMIYLKTLRRINVTEL